MYFLVPEAFFFKQFAGGFTVYGGAVSLALVLGFLEWIGFFRWWIKREIGKKRFLKNLAGVLAILGFRRSFAQVAIGLVLGVCLGEAMWHIGITSPSSSLDFTGWIIGMGIIMVFIMPPIEEVLFRGYLINRCLSSGRGMVWAWALTVAASVFLFSWSHARGPELKVMPGAIFTLVYLWGRGNNMVAAIMTHATGNATILLSAFLPPGTIESAAALGIVVVAISLLVLIIWAVSPRRLRQPRISKMISRNGSSFEHQI